MKILTRGYVCLVIWSKLGKFGSSDLLHFLIPNDGLEKKNNFLITY